MTGKLLNFVCFQVGWFACILGAAGGLPWIGVAFGLTWLCVLLLLTSRRRDDLVLILAAALLGYVTDSALVLGGFLLFPEGATLGGPSALWMVTLWMNLAGTLNHCLSWMKGRYGLAVIFGALGGPLAYFAGQGLGAIELSPPTALTLGWIAVQWAVCMPLLLLLGARVEQASARTDPLVEVEALNGTTA